MSGLLISMESSNATVLCHGQLNGHGSTTTSFGKPPTACFLLVSGKDGSALPPRKSGRAAGSKNDDPKRDRLVRRTIERLYLTAKRGSFARLVEEIRLLCVHDGLTPPSWRTVRARRAELDLRKQALRGDDKLKIAASSVRLPLTLPMRACHAKLPFRSPNTPVEKPKSAEIRRD